MIFKQNHWKKSFSQSGEDMIVDFLLHQVGLKTITYLDVGAHHPKMLSNTYHFYQRGMHGISIEPDPKLFQEIQKYRPRDININCGMGPKSEKLVLYVIDPPTLNTFSKKERDRYIKMGHKQTGEVQVPVLTIEQILNQAELKPSSINFLSLDVEGMDYEILQAIDFKRFRPEILCIETLEYTKEKPKKIYKIIKLIKKRGYIVYADTFINTIFVDSKKVRGMR